MTDKRTFRTTVTFTFESADEDHDLVIRRAIAPQLTALCRAIQATGWGWERESDDEETEGGLG